MDPKHIDGSRSGFASETEQDDDDPTIVKDEVVDDDVVALDTVAVAKDPAVEAKDPAFETADNATIANDDNDGHDVPAAGNDYDDAMKVIKLTKAHSGCTPKGLGVTSAALLHQYLDADAKENVQPKIMWL